MAMHDYANHDQVRVLPLKQRLLSLLIEWVDTMITLCPAPPPAHHTNKPILRENSVIRRETEREGPSGAGPCHPALLIQPQISSGL